MTINATIIGTVENIAKYLPTTTTKRTVRKRSILIYQGEVPRQAYIVITGTFKVYRLSDDGEEQIVGFRTPGDFFSETWIFGKTSSALYYYEALEDATVLTVEREVLLNLFKKHPEVKDAVFDYFVNNNTALLMQVSALEQSRAADKLLLILYYLMFRYGKETKPQEYTISLHLTHTTLASLMGLTRETTTTELGRLKRKGIVHYDAKTFVIYRDKLVRKLGDDSFQDITTLS